MSGAKSFDIPKALVWEAWQRVKADKGAAGIDGQTIGEFETDLSKNLYRIWNRTSSGTYFPPAVKAVPIPKKRLGAGTHPSGRSANRDGMIRHVRPSSTSIRPARSRSAS